MAGLRYGYRRGFPGYEDDWHGERALAVVVEGARRAINDVTKLGAALARDEHPNWEHDTYQLRNAIFEKPAIIEPGDNPRAPRVWGHWGVEATERIDKKGEVKLTTHEGVTRPLTNMDVAVFLEFGTSRTPPKTPWLYAAWDESKRYLPASMEHRCRQVEISGAPQIRDVLGRFLDYAKAGLR